MNPSAPLFLDMGSEYEDNNISDKQLLTMHLATPSA
jgi:hypothetical protein